jgi:hypothetical protein
VERKNPNKRPKEKKETINMLVIIPLFWEFRVKIEKIKKTISANKLASIKGRQITEISISDTFQANSEITGNEAKQKI